MCSLHSLKEDATIHQTKLKQQKFEKRTIEKMELLEKSRTQDQMNLLKEAIGMYKKLRELLESIANTKCVNLINYILESIQIYHEKLRNFLVK